MSTAHSLRRCTLLWLLLISSHLPMAGCNDDSKTDGTMVTESAEMKTFRKAKSESYKGGPRQNKAKAATKKN
jgi:hypothetical protein